jgi:DNA mismatch repair protein MutS
MTGRKAKKTGNDEAGAKGVAAASRAVTPMMAQYLEIKTAHPDSLLFYRMGDFYELFFDDAVAAAQALGIALTKRGKHLGEDIPMCGVPVVRADDYLQRLIKGGFRVAVCDQTEDPAEARKRGSKAVVRRDVVRLVTPGTITEDTLLDARANNFLTSLFRAPTSTTDPGEIFAIASIDISTGEFLLGETTGADLAGELARLSPGEVIAGEELAGEARIAGRVEQSGAALTPVARSTFDSLAGERALKDKLGLATLDGLGTFSRAELATVAALLAYIDLTQIGMAPALRPPLRSAPKNTLVIDAATRANLELVRSQRGERQGSLLGVMDRTVTGAGARELAARLASPLTDKNAISARLDAVAWCLERQGIRTGSRETLKGCPDLARALARLKLERGGPRDLAAIALALDTAEQLAETLNDNGDSGEISVLARIKGALTSVDTSFRAELQSALDDELPLQKRDGGFVRPGYSAELDELRTLRDDARKVIAGLQADYSERTGIKSLKIRHNNVLGYFVETTALNADALMQPPLNETFIHRQTLANSVRFTTTELGETEARIVSAGERSVAMELQVFDRLSAMVREEERALGAVAAALAEIDHLFALAELAEEQNYTRPEVDDSVAFEIKGGRHPVVEQSLPPGDGVFVENDCDLTPADGAQGHIWLLTGPNMAGKSTFLRQNALIVVMAQMGSFVPAKSARIGVVDRVFSRVGASDDLAGGRSTFMVEMVETASILNQAGEHSFVILDEIGRGTATFDGLSIAWACIEHLHEVNKCRALFATHYHELTALANTLEQASNATMSVKEWNDEIVFLHRVVPGAADRSYGIHVAKLAGLPQTVLERAQAVLQRLEGGERNASAKDLATDLPLFAAAPARPASYSPKTQSELEEKLSEINPDELTPREALELLYELRAMRRRDEAHD